ncbi:hypothetical protein GCK32_009917 [Trichostrongylus colubriformis]|uniref:Uncharacterized protein n=1 Tax=Trichostrongylus colubriformis TaxID=6319 RepID=A0AAN8IW87_TRICO
MSRMFPSNAEESIGIARTSHQRSSDFEMIATEPQGALSALGSERLIKTPEIGKYLGLGAFLRTSTTKNLLGGVTFKSRGEADLGLPMRYMADSCSYCQKIKSTEYDNRLAFFATTQKVCRIRTTEAFHSLVAFIYDSVYENEPPPC